METLELEQQTVEALVKASESLSDDQLSLLCWHCGISIDVIKETKNAMV